MEGGRREKPACEEFFGLEEEGSYLWYSNFPQGCGGSEKPACEELTAWREKVHTWDIAISAMLRCH